MRSLHENDILNRDFIELQEAYGIMIKSEKNVRPNITYQDVLQKVALALVIAVVFLLPLVYDDFYFNILQAKYTFLFSSILVAAVAALAGVIVCFMINRDKKNDFVTVKKRWRDSLTIPDFCMIAFFLCAVISTLQSDYLYESFWGNEGRYTGLFLLTLYTFSFFLVSKYFVLKSWHLDVFLMVALMVCIFGITDYFKMDLLGFKVNMAPGQRSIFTSTIGNVNSYAAFAGLSLGVAMTLYAAEKKRIKSILYYISTVVILCALFMALSDNAYLALAALFAFLPLYLFKNKRGIYRYSILISTFFTTIKILAAINERFPEAVVGLDSLFTVLSEFKWINAIIIVCWVASALLWYWSCLAEKSGDEKQRTASPIIVRCWIGLLLIATVVVLFVLWDANFGGNAERYGSLQRYLVFNDDWGTHRGFIWRIAMENFNEFSPMRKLFGYGPDTFGIMTVTNNYTDMSGKYREVYDSAHNEYIQYLITIGIMGLSSYVLLLISSGTRMIKRAVKNPLVMVAFYACLAYNAQAFVNINLPIVSPVMWFMIMIGLSGCRDEEPDKLQTGDVHNEKV